MRKYSRIVLAVSLLLLACKYLLVLIGGYDSFHRPKADWVNYLSYGAVGFIVITHRGFKRGVLMGTILAVVLAGVCIAIKWSLIFGAWLGVLGGAELIGERWQLWELWILADLIDGAVAAIVFGLAGSLLAWLLIRLGILTGASRKPISPELHSDA